MTTKLTFLAALWLAALPLQAEKAPQAARIPPQRENRFLFIVDTSAAMRDYTNAAVQCVAELLASDMRGEFRTGDTLGLWTYSDKLHTEFPMQIWSKKDKAAIASEMETCLRDRQDGKSGRLDKAMTALNKVIKSSQKITVVLIFDGSGSIRGTPFDKNIGLLQKKYARELRLAHVPFVIVLAAHQGVVFDYTINYPGLIAIPHTAIPEPEPETNAPVIVIAPPVTNAPAKPRVTRSLILSGAPLVIQAPAPAPLVTPPPTMPAPALVVVVPPPATPTPVASAPALAPIVPASPPNQVATQQTQPQPQPVAPPAEVETPLSKSPPVSAPPENLPPTNATAIAPPALTAEAAPPAGTQIALFVIAFSLLTIAGVLVVFLVRRSRNATQPSLITQSIDRPR